MLDYLAAAELLRLTRTAGMKREHGTVGSDLRGSENDSPIPHSMSWPVDSRTVEDT